MQTFFENISKMVGFLGKSYLICFVANASSVQENFELRKSVMYCLSYAKNAQSHFR